MSIRTVATDQCRAVGLLVDGRFNISTLCTTVVISALFHPHSSNVMRRLDGPYKSLLIKTYPPIQRLLFDTKTFFIS